jgi:hypothetical protein
VSRARGNDVRPTTGPDRLADKLTVSESRYSRSEAGAARSLAQFRSWSTFSFIVFDSGMILAATRIRSSNVSVRSASLALVTADTTHCSISAPVHPSLVLTSRSTPSSEALVDVKTLDHFVVGAESVISFAERGLL